MTFFGHFCTVLSWHLVFVSIIHCLVILYAINLSLIVVFLKEEVDFTGPQRGEVTGLQYTHTGAHTYKEHMCMQSLLERCQSE